MKLLALVFGVVPLCIPCVLTAATNVNLLAHWKLDEASGSIARDATAMLDGTLSTTGASFVGAGISGNALSLDRSQNGTVVMSHIAELVTNDYSVSVWVKTAVGDSASDTVILSQHEASQVNGMIVFINSMSTVGSVAKASFLLNSGLYVLTSTNSVNDGQWHQIVATYTDGGQSRIYVDGAPAEGIFPSPARADRGAPFVVGGVLGGPGGSGPRGLYSGLIDDVQIYSGVLTDAQVDLLYGGPGKSISELEEPLSITPNGANFVDSVQVTLTSSVAGTVIRYTLDGNDPDSDSTLYSGPITLTTTTTIKAGLFVGSFPASSVRSATFTKLPPISFQPAGGLFTNMVQVTIVNNLGTGSVFYTLDETDPTPTNLLYQTPVSLTAAATVKARVYLDTFAISAVESASFARVYALSDDGVDNAWREQYFGPGYLTDPRVSAGADPDGDGWSNLLEYQEDTDPTDDASHPTVTAGIRAIPLVSWNTIPGLKYRVLRKADVNAPDWVVVLPELVADEATEQYIDAGAPATAIYLIEVVP